MQPIWHCVAHRCNAADRDFFVVTRVDTAPAIAVWWNYMASVVFLIMIALLTSEVVTIVQVITTTLVVMVLGGYVQ